MNALCELCDRSAVERIHGGCQRRLDGRLEALPPAWRALALWLTPAPGGGRSGAPTRDEAPLPVRLDVLDLRARGGIERLTEWERDWRELLGWTQLPFRGSVEETIKGTVTFLRNNLIWACENHPGIRDFDREVKQITGEIESIVDPPERSVRVGYCPTPLDDEEPCGAVLRYFPGNTVLSCPWCRASWATDEWLALAAAQSSAAELEAESAA